MSLPFRSVKEQIAKSAEGYPLLGYAVYYTISDINVKHADFVKLLEQIGLPTSVAPAVQAKSATIKAIKSETKGRKGTFHRKAVDNDAKAGFAIVTSQTVDEENVDVEFGTETKVILNKGDKTLEVSGPNADSIKAAYESFKETYTSDRFRNVVLRLIKDHCQGMNIREKGGVYFIPSAHNETFEKLQALFMRFPTCSLDVIPVIDTAQAKKSMWKALVGEVTEDLRKMQEDVQNLEPDASSRSLQVRLERYEELKSKVELYEILLSGTAHELTTELNKIGSEIRRRMVE